MATRSRLVTPQTEGVGLWFSFDRLITEGLSEDVPGLLVRNDRHGEPTVHFIDEPEARRHRAREAWPAPLTVEDVRRWCAKNPGRAHARALALIE
ncbi:hypothetical protein L6R52_16975 [Myxococcota bacterium]|nr:hypothetical protein [Myxococcota bacterium]